MRRSGAPTWKQKSPAAERYSSAPRRRGQHAGTSGRPRALRDASTCCGTQDRRGQSAGEISAHVVPSRPGVRCSGLGISAGRCSCTWPMPVHRTRVSTDVA